MEDGTVVEIRNHETREIGRGQDKKFESEEMDNQALVGLFDDLLSAELWRRNRAKTAFESNHAMARHLLGGGYEMDVRLAGYRRIRTGSTRIVYRVHAQAIEGLIVAIGQRRDAEVYADAVKRI